MKVNFAKILATFFGIGYLPYFPGTWASIVGLGIYLLLHNYFIIYIILSFLILILGFLISSKAERDFGKKDCRCIVIDEMAAILILLIFIPKDLIFLIAAFLVFRLMDIIKPFPIKKIENFPGSWGIMLDDIMAAVYTLGITQLIKIVGGLNG